MSTYAEQPFTEFEERYFLAEILKKSTLPPSALLNIIREAQIEPAWTEIALPNGRSVSACQHAYGSLYQRTQMQLTSQVIDPSRKLKRPFSSMGDATTNLPRELQPRPPTFQSVNGQQIAIPAPTVMSPVEPQRKKRGRPTKSEFERRQAEAKERGEVWPKPRKPKARPSEGSDTGGAVGGHASAPVGEASTPREISSAGSAQSVQKSAPGGAPTATMYSPGDPGAAPPRTPIQPGGMLPREEQRSTGGPRTMDAEMSDAQAQEPLTGHRQLPQVMQQDLQRQSTQGNPIGPSFTSPQTQQYHGFSMEEARQGHQQGPR